MPEPLMITLSAVVLAVCVGVVVFTLIRPDRKKKDSEE